MLTQIRAPTCAASYVEYRRRSNRGVIMIMIAWSLFVTPRTIAGCVGALVLTLAGSAPAQRGEPGANVTAQVQSQVTVPLPSLSPIVERVSAAVVNISVVMSDQAIAQGEQDEDGPGFPKSPFDDFLRRFFEQQGQGVPEGMERQRPRPQAGRATALGSGFVIDAAGRVVTHNHVVGNADKVTVVLADNSRHPARVVGRDEQTDIALLKIEAGRPLPFVSWGDSDAAKVGDWVVAVGNPFGLGGTVTAGIISALGRNIEAGPYDDFLQIDASINRGNSGGPTFDLSGRVIGINTAIYSPSGGSVGIGFAVPSSLAKTVVAQLQQHGRVTRGWLGVQIQPLTPELAKGIGADGAKGALVAAVTENSPAAKAGLKQGDVIARVNGKEMRDAHDLPRVVAETPPGQKLELTVLRNGKEQTLPVTVAEMSQAPKTAGATARPENARPKRSGALGLQLAPLDDATRQQAGVAPSAPGVVVRGVAPDSVAAGLVAPGDVIVSVNLEPVSDPADAARRLTDGAAKKRMVLLVSRGGSNRFVSLPVDNRASPT
jgi:serine protease Do